MLGRKKEKPVFVEYQEREIMPVQYGRLNELHIFESVHRRLECLTT